MSAREERKREINGGNRVCVYVRERHTHTGTDRQTDTNLMSKTNKK